MNALDIFYAFRLTAPCWPSKTSHLCDSSSVNPKHVDTEFWNREDDVSVSAEDISDSDGRTITFFSFFASIILLLYSVRVVSINISWY